MIMKSYPALKPRSAELTALLSQTDRHGDNTPQARQGQRNDLAVIPRESLRSVEGWSVELTGRRSQRRKQPQEVNRVDRPYNDLGHQGKQPTKLTSAKPQPHNNLEESTKLTGRRGQAS